MPVLPAEAGAMEAARTGEASQLQKERDGLGASSKVRGDSDLGGTTPHAMVGEVCPVAAARVEAGVAHLNLPLLWLPLPMGVEAWAAHLNLPLLCLPLPMAVEAWAAHLNLPLLCLPLPMALEAWAAHLNLPLLCLPLPMAVEAKCFVNPNLAPLTARSNFQQASPRAPQRGTI